MRSETSKLLSSILFLMWLVLPSTSIYLEHFITLNSSSAVLQHVVNAALIAWPMHAAASTLVVSLIFRPQVADLIWMLPLWKRLASILLALKPLIFTSIVAPLSVLSCLHLYALWSSSFAHPSSYLPLLVVLLGNLVMLLIGAAAGIVFPHPATALVTAVLAWILNISPITATTYLTAFLRASPYSVTTAVPGISTLITSTTILLFLGALATGFLLLRVKLLTAAWISFGFSAVLVLISFLAAPPIFQWYRDTPTNFLACQQVHHDKVTVCTTKEFATSLPYVSNEVNAVLPHLEILRPDLLELSFSPLIETPKNVYIPVYILGMENYQLQLAETLGSQLIETCPTPGLFPDMEALTETEATLGSKAYEQVLPLLLGREVQTASGGVLPVKPVHEVKLTLEAYYEQVCSLR